ncbi:MAG: F0F1 ATP synthase subunit epsilon, partial [Lachnospiraceae bacterium]|nr:F0F1 ATP synthase subunit epsilon [Lachnospiraceae bacterium]
MINCEIITPNGPYKTIECDALTAGTIDGERGLLEHHMSTVLMLDISKLVLTVDGEKKYYAIGGGMLFFENGTARVLVDS